MGDAPAGKWRIAVFASGNGSNLQALIDACQSGAINGEIKALVTNNRLAYAVTRARTAKAQILLFEPEKFKSRTLMCSKIAKSLNELNIDLICLAGYMMKIEACLIRSFQNRIINIHPALLPKYGGAGMYGHFVHEAVLAARDFESGCTVHLVDEQYDHGKTLAQARIPVLPEDTPDTLAARVLEQEHLLYPKTLKEFCKTL
jgi:phosphoribosylglycinamide formyltransferase-1